MARSKQPADLQTKIDSACRTQQEVAEIMTARGFPMTRANVWQIERRALRKLQKLLAEAREWGRP